MVDTIKLSGTSEVVAAVPELLGFYPRESLVGVVVADGLLKLTCRLDLPSEHDHLGPDSEPSGVLRDVWGRFEGSGGFLIAFSEHTNPWPVLDTLASQLAADPLVTVHAGQGRWRETSAEGPTGPYRPGENSVLGQPFFNSREQLAESLRPDQPQTLQGRIDAALERLGSIPAQEWPARLAAILEGPASPMVEQAVELAVLVQDRACQDTAATHLDSPATAEHDCQVWQKVAAHTPDELLAPVLGILGVSAWAAGRGAVLSVCLELAEQRLDLSGWELALNLPNPQIPSLLVAACVAHSHKLDPQAWFDTRQELVDSEQIPIRSMFQHRLHPTASADGPPLRDPDPMLASHPNLPAAGNSGLGETI